MDDEILQDFLVEAGEILEDLSTQLVDLEARRDDTDLLNAIFRGFHTVKGGAGFLALSALVDVCHIAENVFDMLRQGKRKVDAELMDVILQALDAVNGMFEEVRNGKPPTPAPTELLKKLHDLCHPKETAPLSEVSLVVESTPVQIPEPEPEPEPEPVQIAPTPDPTPAPVAKEVASQSPEGADITDDDFEKLLDSLYGEGGAPGVLKQEETTPAPVSVSVSVPVPTPEVKVGGAGESDIITDAEFEKLLDQLHGSGKPPVTPSQIIEKASVASAPPKAPIKAPPTEHPEPKGDAKEKEAPTVETTVRVDTSRLDDIMNMVGELVLVRNRLVTLGGNSQDEVMSKAVANLDVVTADLQMAVMKTRMQPIKKVFGRFPRVVRDLARTLKKEISLEMIGEETDLDKNLVEALADPLVHLVRNSVDHGIEMPEARASSGKPRQGTIILSAEQAGDHILLNIIDDGAGMDPVILRKKAIEKGLLDEDAAARLSDKESFNLIFLPGFSTKEQISDISGRGVGMDVVKTKISQLNGAIEINSQAGKGSKISIKVPLTLAILPTLMVVLGGQTFALPLTSVSEIFHLDLTKTNVVDGQLVVIVRDKAIPLFYLTQWLLSDFNQRKKETLGHVVIVSVNNIRVGFVVDGLLGQEEVVIKPLGDMLQGTPGMAGATITGDGRIAMILDVPGLLKRYARKAA